MLHIGVCYGVCFLLWSFHVAAIVTNWGSTIGICISTTLWSIYVPPGDGPWPIPVVHWVAFPPNALSRGKFHVNLAAVFQPFHQNGGAYSFGGSAESHQICPPSLHGREGSPFQGCGIPDDMVNSKSVVAIKPGDSCVMIGYQFGKFTCTWLVAHFIAQSHILLNGLPSFHLILWLLRDVCWTDMVSSSVCQSVVETAWVSTTKLYQQ